MVCLAMNSPHFDSGEFDPSIWIRWQEGFPESIKRFMIIRIVKESAFIWFTAKSGKWVAISGLKVRSIKAPALPLHLSSEPGHDYTSFYILISVSVV